MGQPPVLDDARDIVADVPPSSQEVRQDRDVLGTGSDGGVDGGPDGRIGQFQKSGLNPLIAIGDGRPQGSDKLPDLVIGC